VSLTDVTLCVELLYQTHTTSRCPAVTGDAKVPVLIVLALVVCFVSFSWTNVIVCARA
jgi:hypothetical protein